MSTRPMPRGRTTPQNQAETPSALGGPPLFAALIRRLPLRRWGDIASNSAKRLISSGTYRRGDNPPGTVSSLRYKAASLR
jgi:hypothetical protein